jgi:hypothetical protein
MRGQGSVHVVGACGALQHGASGIDIASGTSGTERIGDVDVLARGTRTNVSSSRHANGSTVEGGESCRAKARRNGMKIIMPPSKAMERQIVSVIASGESHPSMLIMGSSASATMWILVRFYLVEARCPRTPLVFDDEEPLLA